MPLFVFGGNTPKYIGRFGLLKKGDHVLLTEAEAAYLLAHEDFSQLAPVPVAATLPRRHTKLFTTSPVTVAESDNNVVHRIRRPVGAFTVNLPSLAVVPIGYSIIVAVDIDSPDQNPITIDPAGAELIEGAAVNSNNFLAGQTGCIYHAGDQWKILVFVSPLVDL